MLSWVSYLLGYSTIEDNDEKVPNDTNVENKKLPTKAVPKPPILSIKPEDLKSVVLRKHTTPISEKKLKRPALARNSPTNSFHLLRLTKNQLKEILGTKLRPTKTNEKLKEWKSRHPVLRELQEKVPVA